MTENWWVKQGYGTDHPLFSGKTKPGEGEVDPDSADNSDIPDDIPQSYAPARTLDPSRPRTLSAGYDSETQTLQVTFREGAVYNYYNVPPAVWQQYKKSASPGKFINRRLAGFAYGRVQ